MMMMMVVVAAAAGEPECAALKLCIKGCGGQRISHRGFPPHPTPTSQSCLTTSHKYYYSSH